MTKAAGPVRRCRRRASRLLLSVTAGRAGKGIKKPGAPIWPTALVRPEGGPAACGLARDGHKSPECRGAVRRNASGEEDRLRHHRGASSFQDLCARHASRWAVYAAGETDVNPDT